MPSLPRRAAFLALGIATAGVVLRLRPTRIEIVDDSMAPSLLDGDYVVAVGARGPARPGDVVVFPHPGRPGMDLVKRVVRGGGSTAPDGTAIPRDRCWVEGDAAARSEDSRRFGTVPMSAITHRVVAVYWPLRRMGLVR